MWIKRNRLWLEFGNLEGRKIYGTVGKQSTNEINLIIAKSPGQKNVKQKKKTRISTEIFSLGPGITSDDATIKG